MTGMVNDAATALSTAVSSEYVLVSVCGSVSMCVCEYVRSVEGTLREKTTASV